MVLHTTAELQISPSAGQHEVEEGIYQSEKQLIHSKDMEEN